MGIVVFVTNDGFILSSAPNFRDLGGHRAAGGGTVRHGMLYRSDALHTISEPDLPVYNGLGIRQLIDLRTEHERVNLPDITPEGAAYTAVSVQGPRAAGGNFSEALMDRERARAMFADGAAERFMFAVYRELVTDEIALTGYRDLVERAAKGPTALVFHCSAGKDRTGWGAALLLSLLGVDRTVVVADYLASNERQENTDKWMRMLSEHSGLTWEEVAPMARVRAEYLETAFTHVDEVYGSFDGYVSDGLGLSSATVESLRERMIS
ncbi:MULTISPECIES: tyrosine-protein phosphatase [Nocardiopsis]|uniref:Tyrosine-protein phosphatase n=1 Tax=Nocardiopsis lambiniae TaxID=3075539 RepID=A0ABU2MG54_9ACTN|nr:MULTISPECIES: tyrosine-protein phosphatase [unclassified Nocardiopsis]MDE3722655.1 tyrosine-protein phosphatase [Nocardiopsis sp. N85]MDT0330831.1 tyrosine-protein phosphatase [Nocardiopsis sp. DSM 44743]